MEIWTRVIAYEEHVDFVTEFYQKVYLKREDEFFRRCAFICGANDRPVASAFIWQAYGRINTMGWYRVLPEHEGKGFRRVTIC